MMTDQDVRNKPGFQGTVTCKEWIRVNNIAFVTFNGSVTMLDAKEAFGFRMGSGDSNFVVAVRGEKEIVYLLGCQVRAARAHKDPNPSRDCYVVP